MIRLVNMSICGKCPHLKCLYIWQTNIRLDNEHKKVTMEYVEMENVSVDMNVDDRCCFYCTLNNIYQQTVPDGCEYKLEHIVIGQ